MLRAARALGTPLGPRPSLLPAGAAFSVLGVKDAAVAAASKLVEEVKGVGGLAGSWAEGVRRTVPERRFREPERCR